MAVTAVRIVEFISKKSPDSHLDTLVALIWFFAFDIFFA